MFLKFVFVIILLSLKLELFMTIDEPPPVCLDGSTGAVQLLSYYTWWYRILFWWRRSTICRMNEAQRKRLCASVVKLCYLWSFQEVTISDIEEQIISTTQCQKMKISILMTTGRWRVNKRMLQCPEISFEKQKIQLEAFYLSASGKLNAVLVFFNDPTENGLYVNRYAENLAFETNESQLLPV